MKVAVIGLDCFEPSLCFEKWIDDLPTIRGLMERGTYGNLTSTIPPVTVPAWSCMTASKDPGQLGIYGFQDRKSRAYGDMTICTAMRVKEPRLWDILTAANRPSIVVGVPGTFPQTKPVNGCVITDFLTPTTKDPRIPYTYPPMLRLEVERVVGEYLVDVHMGRDATKRQILDQIHVMTERRFNLVRHFIKEKPWELMFMVEMGTDRIHHGFWSFIDPAHRRYTAGNEFENSIRDYYKVIDAEIAATLECLDLSDTAVWLVSDHGATALDGGVLINQWLINNGYLVMKAQPQPRQKFKADDVDWAKTRAWATPGYYGQIFVNHRGREPQGVVDADDVDALLNEIETGLAAIVDDRGQPMGNVCHRPSLIYKACNNIAPELIVIFGDLRWRCSGWVGSDTLYTFDDDANAEDANHAQEGMYLVAPPLGARSRGSAAPAATRREDASIYDVAPSILAQLGIPVPADMIGRVLPAAGWAV